MFPFWLLFGVFATGALLNPGHRTGQQLVSAPLLGLAMIFMALMIGLRFEVGADWDTYQWLFSYAGYSDLTRVLRFGDPGFQLLNWTVRQLDGEIWQVNIICGLIFCWGLLRLSVSQPLPWLAVVVAIPYLVVVVAMGYTRQAVAIGVLMAGLASLHRSGSTLRFAAYVAVAALFHKTAVVALPLVIFSSQRNFLLNAIAGVALCILFYNLFLEEAVGGYVRNYIDERYSSQGAAVRVGLNFLAGALFLMWRKRFGFEGQMKRCWTAFALVAVLFPIALILSASSTAVDRLALYILPLQIVVWSRVPIAFGSIGVGSLAVTIYSATVLYVWLNYAVHAQYWLPYQVYPF